MQQIIALLIMVVQLYTVAGNSSIPQNLRDTAKSLADQSLVQAKIELAKIPEITPIMPQPSEQTTQQPLPQPSPQPTPQPTFGSVTPQEVPAPIECKLSGTYADNGYVNLDWTTNSDSEGTLYLSIGQSAGKITYGTGMKMSHVVPLHNIYKATFGPATCFTFFNANNEANPLKVGDVSLQDNPFNLTP